MRLNFCCSIVLPLMACMYQQANADNNIVEAPRSVIPQTKTIHLEPQPWQQRRNEFAKVVQGVHEGNQTAQKNFDVALTEFETRVSSRTPMENMEILGVFYVPKDGIEKCIPLWV
jgi:hypothetical protein